MSPCPICKDEATYKIQSVYDDRYGHPGDYEIHRCRNCSHRFSTPSLTPTKLETLYTQFYPRKNIAPLLKPLQKPTLKQKLLPKTNAYKFVRPRTSVLDIGCGSCESLQYLKSIECDAAGIDADANVLKIASAQQFEVQIGLFNPTLYSRKFDYVTLDQVIEHQIDPIIWLTHVKEVLKKDGSVLLTTPNSSSLHASFFSKRWIHWHVPYHMHFFTKRSLKKLAKQSGFEVVKIKAATPYQWVGYQIIHAVGLPKKGEPFFFWKNENTPRSDMKVRIAALCARLLDKTGVSLIWSRLLDALQLGDNWVVEMRPLER